MDNSDIYIPPLSVTEGEEEEFGVDYRHHSSAASYVYVVSLGPDP